MAYENEHKSSAELQREIEMQRNRVEATIDQIQEKLSPGQLVDELLAYTKGGGGEFVSTLQRQVTANPLPVALLGVSLAWLIAKPADASAKSSANADAAWDNSINQNRGYGVDMLDPYEEEYGDYPVTTISGTSVRRLSNTTDQHGHRYSEFADEAGKKFRARTDEAGKRAGHFIDETGNRFKGFTSATGERVEHFRDEAGNMLDEASGWASHTWQRVRERMHDARDSMNARARAGQSQMGQAAVSMQNQMDSLNHTIMTQFRDQPLIGGALAFALGAAMGSALPHTAQEDAVMGDASDALKGKVGDAAADVYEQGREKAAELYASATDKAGSVYQQAKEGISEAVDRTPTGSGSSSGTTTNTNPTGV